MLLTLMMLFMLCFLICKRLVILWIITYYYINLKNYGVRGIVLNWISKYLSDRSQSVIFNNVQSEDVVMDYDVPQRSVLGLLLFLIYMNDFNCTSNMIKLLLYADDITMNVSGN